ncbi:hypothetical protein GOODEAATRI_027809, partial [Goodea atripinnis]
LIIVPEPRKKRVRLVNYHNNGLGYHISSTVSFFKVIISQLTNVSDRKLIDFTDMFNLSSDNVSTVIMCLLFLSLDMLHHMDWDSPDDVLEVLTDEPLHTSESRLSKPRTSNISEAEFSCHCCYDILVNPTTLTCGHNFCRHCLALWWESSHKNECPECREKWEGFPKINILLRYAFNSCILLGFECQLILSIEMGRTLNFVTFL